MRPPAHQSAALAPLPSWIACRWILLGLLIIPISATAFAQDFEQPAGPAMEEGGYEGESGRAAPEPAANLTTGPTPMSMLQLIQPDWNPLRQKIAQVMAPSTTPATPPMVGPLLRNEANVAFRYGNLPLARELYFGFLAHGTKEATEDLQSLKFSAYFRRPVWQLRWAVSLGLHGDTDVTDFAPIRADDAAGASNGMEAGMEMSAFDESAADDLSGEPAMMGAAGSPRGAGMSGLDDSSRAIEMPAPSGSAGTDEGYQGGRMDRNGNPGPGGPPRYDSDGRPVAANASTAAAPKAQMTDPAISERFEELMGYVATVVAEGMQTRIEGGQFGTAFANVDPDATDQGDTVADDYVQPSEPRMWIPRVVFLGEGSTQEMSKAAAQQNVELLLHFDVSMKEVRNSTPQNSTRVKVIDGRSGRTLITSGQMENRELQRLLQAERETAESYVNGALEKFWSILDSKLSVQAFPELTPDISRRRVTGVLADPAFSLLRKLAEIQYMGLQGWLTEEEVEQAYAITASTDGMTILYGSPSQSVDAIHEIAERAAANRP